MSHLHQFIYKLSNDVCMRDILRYPTISTTDNLNARSSYVDHVLHVYGNPDCQASQGVAKQITPSVAGIYRCSYAISRLSGPLVPERGSISAGSYTSAARMRQ